MTGELFKNKKGSYSDAIYYILAIFVVALVSVIMWTLFSTINDSFQASGQISDSGKSMMNSLHGRYISVVDGGFIFITVGLLLAIIIGAWFIKSHPALFWISIPVMAFIIWLAAIYGNFFKAFTTGTAFASGFQDFTVMPLIMNNLVLFITAVVLLISIALFAKNRLLDQQ